MSDMSGYDLRKYQDDDKIKGILGKILSGKDGYETVIDKNRPIPKCSSCGTKLMNEEKFCPECGTKVLVCGPTNKDCEVVEG